MIQHIFLQYVFPVTIIISDSTPQLELIPAAHRLSLDPPDPQDGFISSDYSCPEGTKSFSMGYFGGMNANKVFVTCHCEDHCSWYKCRLDQPPLDCLEEESSSWKWDEQRHYWVAQMNQGGSKTEERC